MGDSYASGLPSDKPHNYIIVALWEVVLNAFPKLLLKHHLSVPPCTPLSMVLNCHYAKGQGRMVTLETEMHDAPCGHI